MASGGGHNTPAWHAKEKLPMDAPTGSASNPQSGGGEKPHANAQHPLWMDIHFWNGQQHAPELLAPAASERASLEKLQPLIAPFVFLGPKAQQHDMHKAQHTGAMGQKQQQQQTHTRTNHQHTTTTQQHQTGASMYSTRLQSQHALEQHEPDTEHQNGHLAHVNAHWGTSMLVPQQEETGRRWTSEDDAHIFKLVDEYEQGVRAELSHKIIARELGRSPSAVKARFNNKLKHEWENSRGVKFSGFS